MHRITSAVITVARAGLFLPNTGNASKVYAARPTMRSSRAAASCSWFCGGQLGGGLRRRVPQCGKPNESEDGSPLGRALFGTERRA